MSKTIVVDLLPGERPGFRLDPLTMFLLIALALASLGMGSLSQHLREHIQQQKLSLADLDSEIKKVKAVMPIVEERKTRVRKIEEEIVLIQNISKDPLRYATLLREVAALMPANLYFSNLSLEPGTQTVTVQGTVNQTEGKLPLSTLSDLMRQLNRSSYFSEATLTSTTKEVSPTGPAYAFQLQFKYLLAPKSRT